MPWLMDVSMPPFSLAFAAIAMPLLDITPDTYVIIIDAAIMLLMADDAAIDTIIAFRFSFSLHWLLSLLIYAHTYAILWLH